MAYQQKKINKHLRKFTGTKKTRVAFNRRRYKNKKIYHYDYDDLSYDINDHGGPHLCPECVQRGGACHAHPLPPPLPSKLFDLILIRF